ncbi:MAG: hypothetical protein P4L73_05330 [Caulobacteraceae bacterium]|nr:hypothetical protein [Caulobacteraceae bacterium]
MTVWMTKVWGFGEPVGPLQFSTEGWRQRARSQLQPGDTVALVGTMGPETQADEHNRLLGLMEPTTEPVMALDYLKADREEDFNERGEYKWPFGLLNRAAWRFDEPRVKLADVSSRSFAMDSAQGIVPLTQEEAVQVLALPRTPAALAQSIAETARIEGEDAARRRGAPPPTTTRTGTMHMRRAPAFTYALALTAPAPGSRPPTHLGYKIGWAFDWKARMRTFNHAAMPALGGLTYGPGMKNLWPTAMEAFRMEQAVLRRFEKARNRHNHEIVEGVTRDDLDLVWASCMAEVKRRS